MNNYQFYEVLVLHPWAYLTCLALSACLHTIVFRRLVITFFDPLFLFIVFEVFASSTVYFLYAFDHVSTYNFINFIFCQAAFFSGIHLFRSLKPRITTILKSNLSFTEQVQVLKNNVVIFYISTLLLLMCQSIVYAWKGIPLFMDSRLDTFATSKGEGILGRILDVTAICSLFCFFSVIRFDFPRKSELPKYFLIFLVFITFFLSGSKSTFLLLIYSFWTFLIFSILKGSHFTRPLRVLKKYTKSIVISCVLLVLAVITIQTKQSENGWFMLGLRFVHSGDIYWYAYPNDVYKTLDGSEPFKALFADTFGMLRIYKWDELPQAIGIILKDFHHPTKELDGPNARLPIFGLVYFGFAGSILFSFIVGVIFSFTRNVLPLILGKSVVSGVVFSYLMIKLPSLATDPIVGVTAIDNLIFVLPFILFALLTFNTLVMKRAGVFKAWH
jgi:hypothetical protein